MLRFMNPRMRNLLWMIITRAHTHKYIHTEIYMSTYICKPVQNNNVFKFHGLSLIYTSTNDQESLQKHTITYACTSSTNFNAKVKHTFKYAYTSSINFNTKVVIVFLCWLVLKIDKAQYLSSSGTVEVSSLMHGILDSARGIW